MNYLIHACKQREEYVRQYLIPSMLNQGISARDNHVYVYDSKGLLQAFMESGKELTEGTWHLQDDVILSKDFTRQTILNNHGIVCGFCNSYSQGKSGIVDINDMWYSMPCIRIPNTILQGFIDWLEDNDKYSYYIKTNKHDDLLFKFYLQEKYSTIKVKNLAPNIVNHIDYLLGGSIVNKARGKDVNTMARYWQEPELIDDIERKLR